MNKKITALTVLFLLLATLFNGQLGLVNAQSFSNSRLAMSDEQQQDDSECPDDFPSGTEEDSIEKEGREVSEYDSHFMVFNHQSDDQLLNLHYTYQHLLFKDHFLESTVPPPKG